MNTDQTFIDVSRDLLRNEYRPKIERCLAQLGDEQVWWRPNASTNSIGNLILHLVGNVRQYVLSGIGGAPDVRQRQAEFDERQPIPTSALLARLQETLDEVDDLLSRLDPAALAETRTIQGRERTVFVALYRVVEHFSMHTGQIVYITKLLTAEDLRIYTVRDGVATPTFR